MPKAVRFPKPTRTPADAIRTTLGALVAAEPALSRLLARSLPVKTAYHLGKLGRLVREELAQFQTQQTALIKEFGTEREVTEAEAARGMQGPVTEVTTENRQAYFARVAELQAVEVTLAWRAVALDDLGAIDITGADLDALDPLLLPPADHVA